MGNSWAICLATSFGIGYAPKAPGTFGSLPGLALAYAMHVCFVGANPEVWGLLQLGGVLVALCAIATFSIASTERSFNRHDDKRIVIDEVLGQALALLWFEPSVVTYVIGFGLFRLFDILKPGPIGKIDRNWHTPFGTLLDDLLAGVLAAVVLAVGRLVCA